MVVKYLRELTSEPGRGLLLRVAISQPGLPGNSIPTLMHVADLLKQVGAGAMHPSLNTKRLFVHGHAPSNETLGVTTLCVLALITCRIRASDACSNVFCFLQSSEDLYIALDSYSRQLQGLKNLHQPGTENALVLVGIISAYHHF